MEVRERGVRVRDKVSEREGSDTHCYVACYPRCLSRAVAAGLLLCGLLGDRVHAGATAPAFLSVAASTIFADARHLSARSNSGRSSSNESSRRKIVAFTAATGAPTRQCRKSGRQHHHQQRWHRRCSSRSRWRSTAFSMQFSPDDECRKISASNSSAARQDGKSSSALLRHRSPALGPSATAAGTRKKSSAAAIPAAAAAATSTATGSGGGGGGGKASRLDFLQQTSTAAALVGTATAVGLLASRAGPASAAFETDPPTAEAEVAAAAAAAESMVWLDEDSGTVSSRLSQVDETYGQGFVAYLARFLLNYDEGCREYFKGKLDCAVPKRDGSHIWEEFRGFVASVGLGLAKFQGASGARELCESLSRKYGGERNGAPQQLALLVSLLPPDVQPVPVLQSLLSFPVGTGFRTVKAAAEGGGEADLDLESIFGESPTALLPGDLRPIYAENVKAFFVPGVPRLARESDAELAFGARGPFPISKERRLTAVDFALFAACGAVGCTSTHMTVIPLDVVKTRLQTDPGRYTGLAQGVSNIAKEEGWMMLMRGFGPTLAGYFWYGITVYPGYELFKRLFIELVGPLNAALFRVPLVLSAGALATCFACIGVCPAEAVRIRQVADPSVGSMPSAIRQIVAESGWGKLFEGLPSILFRQISFGMMKFLVFDFFTEFAYDLVPYLAEQTATRLSVSLTSGLVAGVCAAIVSQPADTVLSTMNRSPDRSSIPETIKAIVDERGVGGLFLGLQSRIVWSGAIISGQFLLYDVCKTALHVSADDLRVFLDAISSAGL